MLLLLHPTHRKFINLLKKHVADGNVIILTHEDIEEFKMMFKSTNSSLKRHQILYKIFLRAINRPIVKPCGHDVVVDDLLVKEIEKKLRRIEFKNPFCNGNKFSKIQNDILQLESEETIKLY